MRPVATVADMRAADAAALRGVDEATLVRRAGAAVAREALGMLGPGYGRRVVVVAGKGNNGADGRVAAAILGRRGCKVAIVAAADAPARLPRCDLVVDAAYGTGFHGRYSAPEVPDGVPALAVDIPSGVDGDTGGAAGSPMIARRTVALAALKPGLLQGDGQRLAGEVVTADIGVPVEGSRISLLEDSDARHLVPPRPFESHKWATAVAIVAGSPGMEGAAVLATGGASRAGAGMVRLAVPGSLDDAVGGGDTAGGLEGAAGGRARPGPWPVEAVRLPLGDLDWADDVLEMLSRCRALVIGPGLGRSDATGAQVRRLVERSPVPVVVDADALYALGDAAAARRIIAGQREVVLTPHDGEYARLAGAGPGDDRVAAARRLAASTGAVVLAKGSLTAVAEPPAGGQEGRVWLAAAGSARLATAGTGDVLSGVIGAFLARGLDAPLAAALAAHVHGRAAGLGPAEGLVAGDLPALVSSWLSGCLHGGPAAFGAPDGSRG